MRRRCRIAGLLFLGTLCASATAVHSASEVEHELYRELHKMPPPATLPGPDTVACYARLGKIAHFEAIPIRVEPSQCARYDMVRLQNVIMPDQKLVSVLPAPQLRCSMAEAIAEWVRDDVTPGMSFDSPPSRPFNTEFRSSIFAASCCFSLRLSLRL